MDNIREGIHTTATGTPLEPQATPWRECGHVFGKGEEADHCSEDGWEDFGEVERGSLAPGRPARAERVSVEKRRDARAPSGRGPILKALRAICSAPKENSARKKFS
jgi:hypothetical protein